MTLLLLTQFFIILCPACRLPVWRLATDVSHPLRFDFWNSSDLPTSSGACLSGWQSNSITMCLRLAQRYLRGQEVRKSGWEAKLKWHTMSNFKAVYWLFSMQTLKTGNAPIRRRIQLNYVYTPSLRSLNCLDFFFPFTWPRFFFPPTVKFWPLSCETASVVLASNTTVTSLVGGHNKKKASGDASQQQTRRTAVMVAVGGEITGF